MAQRATTHGPPTTSFRTSRVLREACSETFHGVRLATIAKEEKQWCTVGSGRGVWRSLWAVELKKRNGDCERAGTCNECQDQGIDSASPGSRCSSQDKTFPRPAQGFPWNACKAPRLSSHLLSISIHDGPALVLGSLPRNTNLSLATTRIYSASGDAGHDPGDDGVPTY
jgi:hypothetical protein